MDPNLIQYLPGLMKIGYQGLVYGILTKTRFADSSYLKKQVLEFIVKLLSNLCMNFKSLHVCHPIRTKSKADKYNAIPAGMVTVNNFFGQLLKEIDMKSYGDDLQILPVSNSTKVYKYSNAMLKHIANDQNDITDDNLTERITKFRPIMNTDTVYRISLRFLLDLRLVSFFVKLETKIMFTLETKMNKLFKAYAKQPQLVILMLNLFGLRYRTLNTNK